MQQSMNSIPMERLSEAELKEAFEHIVKIKQCLLDTCENILNIQRALIELNGIPPYLLEDYDAYDVDEIDRCRNIVHQAENNITSLLWWAATEERKLQNTSENQEGKKKEQEE